MEIRSSKPTGRGLIYSDTPLLITFAGYLTPYPGKEMFILQISLGSQRSKPIVAGGQGDDVQ